MDALALGNAIRVERAQLRRQVKAGAIRVDELLRDEIPPCLRSMLVEDLLSCIRRMPHKTVHRFLYAVPIKPTRRCGELTDRQRLALARKVEWWHRPRSGAAR